MNISKFSRLSGNIFFSLALLLLLQACGSAGGTGASEPAAAAPSSASTNSAPVAVTDANKSVGIGAQVTLDASQSSDADGDTLSFDWVLDEKPSASNATLTNTSSPTPNFVADTEGVYKLIVTVEDSNGASDSQEATVTAANNPPPSANAGPDQQVINSSLVRLDGSASGTQTNGTLTYAWSIQTQPANSTATLSNASSVNPTLVPNVDGTYTVSLTVSDGNGSSIDIVSVVSTSGNSAPVAAAGSSKQVSVGSLATLDGSGSSDANGDLISYAWEFTTKPSGSSAAFDDATVVAPKFLADLAGSYIASLTVSDGSSSSQPSNVTVTATNSNLEPQADAGPNRSIRTGEVVQLNGSASSDPEGSNLDYAWVFISRAAGSSSTLIDAGTVAPSFTADASGTYLVELTVSDGTNTSQADRTSIVATVSNGPPIAAAGANQTVNAGENVVLDGTASNDPDDDPLAYSWLVVSKPASSGAYLANPNQSQPSFNADVSGNYVLSLSVNDGNSSSQADSVTITAVAGNSAPTANAGNDVAVLVAQAVSLSGTSSFDPDGDSLTYDWSVSARPAGSTAALSTASAAQPSFTPDEPGSYTVQLVVSDGSLSSSADAVSITASSAASNNPPVANAGPDGNVMNGDNVILNGSGSNDPDGDSLTYQWSLSSRPAASSATLQNANQQQSSFVADVTGQYGLTLSVTDSGGLNSNDSIVVTSSAGNQAPTANAGANQAVSTGDTVSLDGTASSDPNGDALTYNWAFSGRPGGSTAVLSNTSAPAPQFTADAVGSYTLQLTVNDGQVNSAPTSVTVTSSLSNQAPSAAAGANQSVIVSDVVSVNGQGSSDADGDSLTYAWSFNQRPAGSNAVLSGAANSSAQFTTDAAGNYRVQLIVNDGSTNSAPDYVDILASPSNQAPSASAGVNQTVTEGNVVTLNGSASNDPDGDALTYSWTFTTRPGGSTSTLSNSAAVNPTFTADTAGTYNLQLIVSDGQLSSAADSVTITSNASGGGGGGATVSDNFDGNGALINYVTNNASALPDVTRTNGRYRAHLTDNTGNKTAHFNASQGRLDAKLVSFPFEYIARNAGIGTAADSQSPVSSAGAPIIFSGIQVHVSNLASANSAHIVIGHKGGDQSGLAFTVEGKNTVNGKSATTSEAGYVLPSGRGDLRIVGNPDRTLSAYWQATNPNPGVQADNWTPYKGTGNLPLGSPNFGAQVYVGLITYAYGTLTTDFVGTADSVQLVGE